MLGLATLLKQNGFVLALAIAALLVWLHRRWLARQGGGAALAVLQRAACVVLPGLLLWGLTAACSGCPEAFLRQTLWDVPHLQILLLFH